MKKVFTGWSSLLAALFVLAACCSSAGAAPILVSPSPAPFGEIERITLNDPTDVYSGGVMVAGGVEMIIPKNLLIDLPANRLSLQQIFDQAPAACKTLGESGLAKADKCNGSGSGGIATLSAVRTNAGNVIIGDLFIMKAGESVNGRISYINYNEGYYRVNGIDNDPNTGAMVRLNDPSSRHTIQSGLGCAGGPNCSPDPRFTLDPDNYTNTFATGYPVCIPSTVARPFPGLPAISGIPAIPSGTTQAVNGTGDLLCPSTNRTPGVLNEPAVADSRRFAPVLIGDSVLAEGNYETINGVRFLSAHTTTVQKALATRNAPDQPDYLFLAEVGTEAPAFQNQRLVNLFIGFTTLAPTDVDIWSVHRDPANNAIHEFPYASVLGCDTGTGRVGECSSQGLVNAGANIFKINYKVDFIAGVLNPRLSPCTHLRASRFANTHPGLCAGGASIANDFAVMSPSPHEIIARTGHKIDIEKIAPGSLVTIDVNGAPATNGTYLFPLGLNLGGLGVAEMSEIDLNALDTPVIFEGIPWNLDRRLGPAGCLNNGGVCEAGAVGSAAFALDPFPFSGLDPRLQASLLPTGFYNDPVFNTTGNTLSNIRNRMFSYVDGTSGKFKGDATVLPYALGTFPVDPPLIPINPTPVLTLFSPVAVNDNVTTIKGAVIPNIDVLFNDVPVMGTIDRATVTIVSSTANGTPTVNFDGTIRYAPIATFTGTDTFTYKVANNFGGYSNVATVTVTVASPPVANNDNGYFAATGTQISINVIGNDTSTSSNINPTSVNFVSHTCGTVFNPANGTLLFTAPATVPAVPGGICTIDYVVSDSLTPSQISNVATVTVTINPGSSPVAFDDPAATNVNSQKTINVLANDTAMPGNTIDPTKVTLTLPLGVIASADPVTGLVTYTAPYIPGIYTFGYTIKDNTGAVSNPATVTVTVTSTPPVANSFPVATDAGVIANINIIPNVAQGSNPINPASLAVTQPTNGSVVTFAGGTVDYVSSPGFTGTDAFTYTVRDTLGTLSNSATVTLNVTAPVEVLTVTTAQYIVSGATWLIEGASTTHGGTVDIYNNTVIPAGLTGDATYLGPASILPDGTWTLLIGNLPAPNATPNTNLQVSVKSSNSATLSGPTAVTLVVR